MNSWMYENEELRIGIKKSFYQWTTSHSFDFRKEINKDIYTSRNDLKNAGKRFFNWHLHPSQEEFKKCGS